ncbi:MAG: putative holin-like toxin [Bavariicoccus seileri]
MSAFETIQVILGFGMFTISLCASQLFLVLK